MDSEPRWGDDGGEMLQGNPAPVGRITLTVVVLMAIVMLGAITVAILMADAALWMKAIGLFVVMLAGTGFAIRMWLISHPYGAKPPRER